MRNKKYKVWWPMQGQTQDDARIFEGYDHARAKAAQAERAGAAAAKTAVVAAIRMMEKAEQWPRCGQGWPATSAEKAAQKTISANPALVMSDPRRPISPEDKLLAAIFGDKIRTAEVIEAEEADARKALVLEARQLCEKTKRLDYGSEIQWAPALIWGHPSSVGEKDGVVVRSIILNENGEYYVRYCPVSEFDKNTPKN